MRKLVEVQAVKDNKVLFAAMLLATGIPCLLVVVEIIQIKMGTGE